MSIVKLKEVGDSLTMTVTECEAVKGNYGDQVKFVGNGDTLFLPKDSADRQLDRLNLTAYADVVGETLTFSRTENKKKGAAPYWNVDVATPATTTPSKRLPPPEQRTTKTAHRAGPDIPGMDEAMEEGVQDDDDFEAWSASLDAIARGEKPEEPALIPREVREREAAAKGERSVEDARRDLCVQRYLDVYAAVYGGLVAVHHAAGTSATVPHGRATDLVPLSSETIHAAASTIYIEQGKQGLNR